MLDKIFKIVNLTLTLILTLIPALTKTIIKTRDVTNVSINYEINRYVVKKLSNIIFLIRQLSIYSTDLSDLSFVSCYESETLKYSY